jgi:hypothetical protein
VKPRLQVNGARLIAARLGGCLTCPVRVTRTVVISSRLRDVAGTPAIPMDDLVGAFEGRLRVDSTGTQLDIHAGRCTWCILEPASRQSLSMKGMQRTIAALTLAMLTAAAGCGGDDGSIIDPDVSCGVVGTFEGTASGTGAASLDGCSQYVVADDGSGPFFGMVLTNGSDIDDITHTISIDREGARPAPGTYNVGDETGEVFGGVFLDQGDRNFFFTSGTVTITTSAADNVTGSLNVTATEFGGTATMTITGNFAAKCVQGNSSTVTFSC